MTPTVEQLLTIGGVSTPSARTNAGSLVTALARYGAQFGLDLPHRVAQYLAQLAEESGGWKWDKELASGAEYEGRHDLGNTQPGDGVRFKGRTMGQITGRANYRAFTKWVRANIDTAAPDFEANPDLLNTDPWEGLGPIWFWATHKLNALADEGDIEQITKKWNGGLNGFAVRVNFLVRASLVLLGMDPTDVAKFQKAAQIEGLLPAGADQIDGDPGPKTRSALHQKLVQLSPSRMTMTTKAAPVTETVTVDKPVAVDVKAPGRGIADAATGAGVGAGALGGTLQTLQEQLTPFSMAGGWIGKLVVVLIIVGAVLAIGGLAWRWWSSRKKQAAIAAINAPASP